MDIRRQGRHWGVYDAEGVLICLTVYKRGAVEVVQRLSGGTATNSEASTAHPTGEPAEATLRRPRRTRPVVQPTATTGSGSGVTADRVAEGPARPRRIGIITLHVEVLWEEQPP